MLAIADSLIERFAEAARGDDAPAAAPAKK